jgi:hypothetical protein
MAQINGRVTLTLAGKRLASKEGAKLMTGGVEREPVLGDGGVLGYTEKTVAPGVECTIAYSRDTRLADLNATTDATLIFKSDTGREYILTGAFLTKPCEINKDEVALSFAAITCEEV